MSLVEILRVSFLEALIFFCGWLFSAILAKRLRLNIYLAFGLGITLILGFMVLCTGWLTTFGVPISSSVSSIVAIAILILCIVVYAKIKTLKDFSIRKSEYLIILLLLGITHLVVFFNSRFGDLGWDSNAYHLPLTYELHVNSALGWDDSVGLGYYTFFTPYGIHSLFATTMAFSGTIYGISFINAIFAVAISLLAGGISSYLGARKSIVVVAALGTLVIPSVIGQVGHNYIDLATGTFWLASAGVLIILHTERRNFDEKYSYKNIYIPFTILIAASLSSKTHQIVQVLPMLALFLVLTIRANNINRLLKSILVIVFSIVFGSFPYIRNLVEYHNPIYPIQNALFPKGNIAYSEFSPMLEGFRPKTWGTGIAPIDSLIVTPLVSMIKVLMINLRLLYDIDRPDLAIFTYDSTISGAGALFTVTNTLAVLLILLLIIKNYRKIFRLNFIKHIDVHGIFIVIPILSIMVTPGNYWPRYTLGPTVLFSTIILSLIQKYIKKYFIEFLAILLLPLIVFGFTKSYEYETTRFRNVDVKIQGLNGNLPKDFLNNCRRAIVLEPRPVFTSLISYANCENVSHKNIVDFNESININGDFWLIASKEVLGCSTVNSCSRNLVFKNRPEWKLIKLWNQRAWFDDKGFYETILIKVGRNLND